MSQIPSTVKKNKIGFYELLERPSSAELKNYYESKYFQNSMGSYEHIYSAAELNNINGKTKLRAETIIGKLPKKGKILDVGCGEGFLLSYFKNLGWEVRGLDYSSEGILKQNPHCEKDLRVGDVFSLLAEEEKSGSRYDVIWLQNVLEHVLDPTELMVALKKLVDPNGYLVVTVPNDFSALQIRALETDKIDHLFWIAIPDHISYFSNQSLKNIGIATGWMCENIIGDFPVDWYLFNQHSNYVKDETRGKAAHLARVEIENLILERSHSEALDFFTALAAIGMGRCITAFFKVDQTK